MGRRIRWLGIALILCFALVLIQLTNLQVRQAGQLSASPGNPRNHSNDLDNDRGDILAADATVLAYSHRVANTGSYQYQRVYPQATANLFSDVVGYASNVYGTWGVEYQYNDQLIPHSQPASSLGQLLNPTSGTDDVTLTVEPRLQQAAASALAGRDGAVVVLNPSTGAVLAMYANPTFDPNPLASPSPAVQTQGRAQALAKDSSGYSGLSSLAYAERWAPGSTFKIITTSAAYDAKPALVNKAYPVEAATTLPGSNLLLHNDGGKPCGGTIAQMLPESCDPGYANLGLDIGANPLYQQATQFGYNSVPPLDLPGVVAATFPAPDTFTHNLPGLAYSAIGQEDVTATALQGALEAAAIANKGVIMTPHVMAQIRNSQGALVSRYTPTPWRRATTAATAAAIAPLMQAVVTSPGGTASRVGFLAQDQVAAKTGTAQAGQSNELVTAWMIAFAPASAARVAIAVVLPDQQFSATGAEEAGPVMKAMIEAALSMGAPLPPVTTARVPASQRSAPTTSTAVPSTTAPNAPTTTAPSTTTTSSTSPASTTSPAPTSTSVSTTTVP